MRLIKKFQQLRTVTMGMNQRNIDLIYPHNARKNYKYADDKYLAKQLLQSYQIPCPKTYAVIDSVSRISECWSVIQEWNELVIKPAKGAGGKGILILKRRGEQWFSGDKKIDEQDIFSHIANIVFGIYSFGDNDVALVEEYIRPHRFFQEIFEEGVPDIRIVLLKSIPLMGMLRMPTKGSKGKANLHQGGLGIGIDISSGCLKQAYDGRTHTSIHPDSNEPISGKTLPFWKEALEMCVQASHHFPLDFLGVDLIIDDRKGPMIMEVNVRPGLGIQLANKKGLKQILNEKSTT